jgi:hypothetical protein
MLCLILGLMVAGHRIIWVLPCPPHLRLCPRGMISCVSPGYELPLSYQPCSLSPYLATPFNLAFQPHSSVQTRGRSDNRQGSMTMDVIRTGLLGLREGAAMTGIPFIAPIANLLLRTTNIQEASVRTTFTIMKRLISTLTGYEAAHGRLGGGHGQTAEIHLPVEQSGQLVRAASARRARSATEPASDFSGSEDVCYTPRILISLADTSDRVGWMS